VNYLAHFHLAYGKDELIVGALLGDFIKGPLNGDLVQPVEQGIMLHRKIDSYTDQHKLLRSCHQQFDPTYRRYAGIMTDVVFDHFLSKHWPIFHPQPLADFNEEVFQLLRNNPQLSERAQKMADILDRNHVFAKYREWSTVNSALKNIGLRLKGVNPLNTAAAELRTHYDLLEETFFEFYQQLQEHVSQQRHLLSSYDSKLKKTITASATTAEE